MENKVEIKRFINGKEVELIADKFGTRVFIDRETIYVCNYDDIVVTIKTNSISTYEDKIFNNAVTSDAIREECI